MNGQMFSQIFTLLYQQERFCWQMFMPPGKPIAVKTALHKYTTKLVNGPPGCTGRVQPLDVCINTPFKEAVKHYHEARMTENLQLYTKGKLSASDKQVLLTRWVGRAWQEINQNH